ncbi:MAG: 2'-deoxycytidine 5'-triphosphate deaminase [Nitrospirae bacterium]|nr:2'-deoxycytidine 5'-triphosphate deaminase [Nitrospirota bacterium]
MGWGVIDFKGNGTIPVQVLKQLVSEGVIKSGIPVIEKQYQPSSIDLRLGNKAYRVRSSFLPQRKNVDELLNELFMYEVDLDENGILDKKNVYIIPLMEELHLPCELNGKTNPKSTTGRLDVFTRVITDKGYRFDEIEHGYSGKLYLEVFPRSFTVKVKTGQSLNQLRLFCDRQQVEDAELKNLYNANVLLFGDDGVQIAPDSAIIRDGLYMRVDLKGHTSNGIIGFKAKRNSSIIDLSKVGEYLASDYWEPVHAPKEGFYILEPEEFYIFASKEKVRVPVEYAAEMIEFDAGSGELRTHYAGFFDSGFGYGYGEVQGTRSVLEVRPHDVPFRIEDGQVFFKIRYEKMSEKPNTTYGAGIGSNYYAQELALSKHFKNDFF